MLCSNINQEFRIRKGEPEEMCYSNTVNRDNVCMFYGIFLKKINIQFKVLYLSNSAVVECVLSCYHNNNVANIEIIT